MPNTGSLNMLDPQTYKGYTEQFAENLLSMAYFQGKTAALATPHDGVKGRLVLTNLLLGELVTRWSSKFNAPEDQIKFGLRQLNVEAAKVELSFTPQTYESSYLGMFRKKGQSSDDLPFEGFILQQVMMKVQQEIEIAMWQAKKTATPTSADKLMSLFDGFLEKVNQIQATGHAPVAVPGGAYTQDNIIAHFEQMFDTLGSVYQDLPMALCVPPHLFKLYNTAYREKYSKYVDKDQNGRYKLDFSDVELVKLPGMGRSNRVVLTPISNLHYGYDDLTDSTSFNFEKLFREMNFWMDFKMDVNFGLVDPDLLVFNDLV